LIFITRRAFADKIFRVTASLGDSLRIVANCCDPLHFSP
jgi:hypothetical protein